MNGVGDGWRDQRNRTARALQVDRHHRRATGAAGWAGTLDWHTGSPWHTAGCAKVCQCARIGFGGKQGAVVIGDHRNRRAIGFRVDSNTDRQSPAGRAAAHSQGRGLAHSLVSTLSTHE